jgi:DNA polymerase-3 subunit delta
MKTQEQENDYLRLKWETQAGKLRSVYIFSGSEDVLMDEAVKEIYQKLLPYDAENANLSRIDGREYSLVQVLDMVETVSLFGDARFIIVADALYFGKDGDTDKEALDRLLALHTSRDAASCVIFYAPDFVKTKKAHKELSAGGALYRFEPLKSGELYSWLREQLKKANKTATSSVLTLLVDRIGKDLRRLSTELDKLVTYLGPQQELDEKSIMLATARSLQGDIFALTDAVVYGHTAKALALLKDLLGSGEPALRILAMLVRQFRLLGESIELLGRGCASAELASRLNIHPYAAQKLAAQAQKINEDKLIRAVELLLQTDLDIKRGRIDQTLALETLVVALGEKSA